MAVHFVPIIFIALAALLKFLFSLLVGRWIIRHAYKHVRITTVHNLHDDVHDLITADTSDIDPEVARLLEKMLSDTENETVSEEELRSVLRAFRKELWEDTKRSWSRMWQRVKSWFTS